MSLEQTKALLNAMHENVDLIEMLTDVITEPVFYTKGKQDKTLALLKGAGLIEELDDDYFMPGERFDALQQIIDTSRFASTVSPDIGTWFKDFRQACQNYKLLSEQEVTDTSINSLSALRQVGRLSARITNSFQVEIREIDADIGNNLNNFPRHEDKIRQSQFYLDRLGEIQNEKLTRLTYNELMKLSTCDATAKIVLLMDRKLYDLRENLIRVLSRVSDFNFHVREQSKRKAKLSQLFNNLSNNALKLDADDLKIDDVRHLALPTEADVLKVAPHLAVTELGGVEEGVLNDLVGRANLSAMFDDVIIEPMDKAVFMDERAPIDAAQLTNDYARRFAEISSNLFRNICSVGEPVSIMDYWLGEDFKDISPNAWLCVMGEQLFEVQDSLGGKDSALIIRGVKRKRSEFTQIRILSDILVEYRRD